MKKKANYKISFVGSGKVATALAQAFQKNGLTIQEIWSHDFKNAQNLAKKSKAKPIAKIEKMNPNVDLFIVAVKDDFIEEATKKIPGKNPFIVHTSGTVSLKKIKLITDNSGVFYPLQSFTSKNKVEIKNTPILFEGNNSVIEKRIIEIAKTVSQNIKRINSKQRKQIHLAAVFVANFPNYFYTIAESILKQEKISFEILLPLIQQVTLNLSTTPPSQNQTGPAIRKDKKTIQNHLELLNDNKEWQKIYASISQSIMNHSFENDKK